MAELEISAADRRRFLDALTTVYHTQARSEGLLNEIGFAPKYMPSGDGTAADRWSWVFHELDAGLIRDGYRALLTAVLEV